MNRFTNDFGCFVFGIKIQSINRLCLLLLAVAFRCALRQRQKDRKTENTVFKDSEGARRRETRVVSHNTGLARGLWLAPCLVFLSACEMAVNRLSNQCTSPVIQWGWLRFVALFVKDKKTKIHVLQDS
jgi:hypothetical protein